jgi:rRNA-processing protein FCF1
MNHATPNPDRAKEILQTVDQMAREFMKCHYYVATNTQKLAELLREAESRGVLLQDAFALADVGYWLEHLDWQSKFLGVVLAFAQDPSQASLKPLIELYGRDRDRMKIEVEILERQLQYRLAHFAKPDDATVRKAIMKNEQRVLAVYVHTRAGYGGAALARFFKVPRTTAYGWISWFESLPEGLREGILAFMATQVPIMAACQVPAAVPKAEGGSQSGGPSARQPSPHGADAGSGRKPSGSGVPVVKSA